MTTTAPLIPMQQKFVAMMLMRTVMIKWMMDVFMAVPITPLVISMQQPTMMTAVVFTHNQRLAMDWMTIVMV